MFQPTLAKEQEIIDYDSSCSDEEDIFEEYEEEEDVFKEPKVNLVIFLVLVLGCS